MARGARLSTDDVDKSVERSGGKGSICCISAISRCFGQELSTDANQLLNQWLAFYGGASKAQL
jgi:hypothetical protein